MDKPKIYLETTIFNFPFADDAPQYRTDTLRLFEEIKAGKFEPYTSEYVIRELDATANEDKRARMKSLLKIIMLYFYGKAMRPNSLQRYISPKKPLSHPILPMRCTLRPRPSMD